MEVLPKCCESFAFFVAFPAACRRCENLQVGHLRAGEGTSNQRVRYMFSGEIESVGKTNSPKNVPDPDLR